MHGGSRNVLQMSSANIQGPVSAHDRSICDLRGARDFLSSKQRPHLPVPQHTQHNQRRHGQTAGVRFRSVHDRYPIGARSVRQQFRFAPIRSHARPCLYNRNRAGTRVRARYLGRGQAMRPSSVGSTQCSLTQTRAHTPSARKLSLRCSLTTYSPQSQQNSRRGLSPSTVLTAHAWALCSFRVGWRFHRSTSIDKRPSEYVGLTRRAHFAEHVCYEPSRPCMRDVYHTDDVCVFLQTLYMLD